MAELIHTAITSLDGFIEDEGGGFDWAAPDPEVHAFVNDLERDAGTYLYGRRLYETMAVWEAIGTDGDADVSAEELDYAALWRAADKVVFSRTLEAATTSRTRVERSFDPAAVRAMKEAADRPLSIGGADLGGQALAAGVVDELRLVVYPVVVGGGKRALPAGARLDLRLLDERRFANGAVYLRYQVG